MRLTTSAAPPAAVPVLPFCCQCAVPCDRLGGSAAPASHSRSHLSLSTCTVPCCRLSDILGKRPSRTGRAGASGCAGGNRMACPPSERPPGCAGGARGPLLGCVHSCPRRRGGSSLNGDSGCGVNLRQREQAPRPAWPGRGRELLDRGATLSVVGPIQVQWNSKASGLCA